VTSVVLDMDSPGGEAAGAMETADEVRELSRIKR
jgi:ClpP class serine protease